jgi:hypothetical protein
MKSLEDTYIRLARKQAAGQRLIRREKRLWIAVCGELAAIDTRGLTRRQQ